ncbi:MAG: phage Gp37/Gp68 family protein [Deltaproteobacteria bacterium]|nr:phage Gp37/Gp68 family protein [Deltaproteobacteria bacterium]
MGSTTIEWTDATWNPVRGCTRVSEGCRNCYAERMAARFSDPGQYSHGFAKRTPAGGRWTGKVELIPGKLREPLSWRKPRRVFVNSMSDLFHEQMSFDDIAAVFGVMAACPQHVFQVLTKRPELAHEFYNVFLGNEGAVPAAYCAFKALERGGLSENSYMDREVTESWPLPNVWLGTSVEDQYTAERRIPYLLGCPAPVRFLSCEPLLGPVDLTKLEFMKPEGLSPGAWLNCLTGHMIGPDDILPDKIDWVIAGGESGPGARPMHPDWVRSLRDQCEREHVPFFFKQWGQFCPYDQLPEVTRQELDSSGSQLYADPESQRPLGVGKKRAGNLLDGNEWNQFPVAERNFRADIVRNSRSYATSKMR